MSDGIASETLRTSTPGPVRAWLAASRLPTLAAAVVPVAVGAAVAHVAGGFRLWPTMVAAWGAIWIQLGTNFANDVFDFEKGADTEDRLGPTRAVQAGWLSAEQMRRGMWVAFAMAALGGLVLTFLAGLPILIIGILSIVSGIAYTGGPFSLGYNGLGDVFVMLFFGFVAVAGTAYANMLSVPTLAWWAAIPAGALATAILVVNNLRDRPTDVLVGKRTLAVRFGRGPALAEYALLLLVSYGVPLVLWLQGANPWIFLPWITLPLAADAWRGVGSLHGKALNGVLVATARLLIVFGLLFTLGLVFGYR